MRRSAVPAFVSLAAWPLLIAGCGQSAASNALSQQSSLQRLQQRSQQSLLRQQPPAAAAQAQARTGSLVLGVFDLKINTLERRLRHNDGNQGPTQVGVRVSQPASTVPEGALKLHVFAKDAPGRTGIVLAEVHVENTLDVPLEGVSLTFSGRKGGVIVPGQDFDSIYDYTVNPFNDAPTKAPLFLDRIAPRGLATVWVGIPHQFVGDVSMKLTVNGKTSSGVPQVSRALALSPDDAELWSAFADGQGLAVVDTTTENVVARLAFEGRPASVAMSPDGVFVYVALADTNKVLVIDRVKREVVQTLTEADGVGRELRNLVVSPDGNKVFVAGYVSDTLAVFERAGTDGVLKLAASLPVGRRPGGLSVSADGETVFVSHFLPRGGIRDNESWVTIVDAKALKVAKETRLRDQFNRDNTACSRIPYDNPFLRLKTGPISSEDVEMEGVFSQMAGVFLTPNGTQAWLPGVRVAGGVQVWETGPNARKDVSGLVTFQPGELALPIVLLMDTRGKTTLVPQVLNGYERPVEKTYSKCMAFEREFDFSRGDFRKTKPNELVSRLASYPTGMTGLSELGLIRHVEFTRGGRRALLLSPISDEIAVQDAATGHPTSIGHFALSGSNPHSMVVRADGAKAYVNYLNSADVSVVDLSAYNDAKNLPGPSYVPYVYKHSSDIPQIIGVTGRPKEKWLTRDITGLPQKPPLRETNRIDTGLVDTLDPEMRRGKILFHSSNPDKYPVSVSRAGACAGCHPDGHADGSAWSTMEGERRTMSLRGGVAGRGWLHISATHADAEEFVHTVVKERLGGTLDKADETALAKYIAFGIPRLQSPVVEPQAAARGKALFEASCRGCHSDAQGGSGNADANHPFGGAGANEPFTFDIGTGRDLSFVTLGPVFEKLFPEPEAKLLRSIRGDKDLGASDYTQQVLDYRPRPERKKGAFKSPSLVNVWDHAVFFHHGHVGTLSEAVKEIETRLGLEMSESEHEDMLAYLKTL
ncbi:MAG: beta-propeller fold lactonase family protein [Silvanigrellales bacterium]|nr:beta-propeller fold lactonase family protein [Silvanigrellales bacterium]